MRLSIFHPKPKPKPKRIYPVTPLPVIKELLLPRIPEQSAAVVFAYLESCKVHFRISRQRHSKTGDFRPAHQENPARITVNGNLNSYSFLITLVHELAHLLCFEEQEKTGQRRARREPHGKQWKSVFREMMEPMLNPWVFPLELLSELTRHMKNPKASATSDPALSRALKEHDQPSGGLYLEELPVNAVFRLHNGKRFRKMERLRKRYKCISIDDGRVYLISPIAVVFTPEFPSSQ
ncbi:MAG: SprT-like domain-containing protein [bacterium]